MKVRVVYADNCKDGKLLAEDMARYARTYAMPISEYNIDEEMDLLVIGFEETIFKNKDLNRFMSLLSREKVKNVALFNMFYFSENCMHKMIDLCYKYDLPLMRETYSCKKRKLIAEHMLTDEMISGGREFIEDMINICINYY